MSIKSLVGRLRTQVGALLAVAAREPTESSLTNLLNMSIRTASLQAPVDLPSAREAVRLCVKETGIARTYCSRVLVRDRTRGDLLQRDHVWLEWRLDFVAPDRYHVKQGVLTEEFPDGSGDEWITIGKEHYTCLPVWLRADEGLDVRPHHLLLADKYLQILSTAVPDGINMYRYRDLLYLLLEYQLGELPEVFGGDGHPIDGGFHINIWVEASTSLLAKAVVVSDDQQTEREQVFVSYNEKVVVERPHTGMEPNPGEPGTYKVTDNRLFPTPFHN